MRGKRGTKATKNRGSGLNMRITLMLFALIPMVVSIVALGLVFAGTISTELKTSNHNALVSVIKETGVGFDYIIRENEISLLNYSKAPVIREYLQKPTDSALAAKAQKFTEDTFGNLNGWEGIYLADWNSKVLTHSQKEAVGMVIRKGDSLKELQDTLLSVEGVYNLGIITSPASGKLTTSMYAVIYDDNKKPIGYVGGGTLLNEIAPKFTDVTSLELSSAYVYFIDSKGTMLYHPDESKIGSPVENEAAKELVAKLAAGEHPQPESIAYLYKGNMKYAAYYVGEDESYIAILTVDEANVLSNTNKVIMMTAVFSLLAILVFAVVTIIISKRISNPLKEIAGAIGKLSEGDVTVECNAKSGIMETASVIGAFQALKDALNQSMSNVHDSANKLHTAILNVDDMTSNNADSIRQINSAINEVARTSQAVAENAQTIAERAIDLGNDIEVLNDNVIQLFDNSQSIKEANDTATHSMNDALQGASESVDAVQSIAAKISETNTAIEMIGSAIEAIESIASQTNLLSLNASIEAARAGEAGRGFAVVAEEIRTLADSSAESAREIREIIENVVSLSSETVEISNKVYEVISKEQMDIENTQSKFTLLSDSVESSITRIDTIREITARLDEIKGNLTNATSDLGAISEELGATSQEVAANCQMVSEACVNTQTSSVEMRNVNEDMSAAIDYFKL